jgi:hypothetical protein
MVRKLLSVLAVLSLVGATLIPDPADARRGGGARAGGGRAVAVRGPHGGGAVRVSGVRAGRAHVSQPIAGRAGMRTAYRAGAYRGATYGAYRGYGRGAVAGAAVGAAAVGAAGAAYYGSGCGYDTYGNWVCPRTYYPY